MLMRAWTPYVSLRADGVWLIFAGLTRFVLNQSHLVTLIILISAFIYTSADDIVR